MPLFVDILTLVDIEFFCRLLFSNGSSKSRIGKAVAPNGAGCARRRETGSGSAAKSVGVTQRLPVRSGLVRYFLRSRIACQCPNSAGGTVLTGPPDEGGVGLMEMVVVLAISMVFTAISMPSIQSTLKSYHLNSAVAAIAGAIQSTRYMTITYGCPHTVTFVQTTATYRVANQALTGTPPTCAVAFTNLGGLVSWSGTQDVSMTPSTTLQFSPNGMVTATVGTLTFAMTNGITTKTVAVSGVGNVNVSP